MSKIIKCPRCGKDVCTEFKTCWFCDSPISSDGADFVDKAVEKSATLKPPQRRAIPDLSQGLTQDEQKDYLTVPPDDEFLALQEARLLVSQLINVCINAERHYNNMKEYTRFNPNFRFDQGGVGIMSYRVRGTSAEQRELSMMGDLKELIKKRLTLILDAYRITEKELPSEYVRCKRCGTLLSWYAAEKCGRCGWHNWDSCYSFTEEEREYGMKKRVFGYRFKDW